MFNLYNNHKLASLRLTMWNWIKNTYNTVVNAFANIFNYFLGNTASKPNFTIDEYLKLPVELKDTILGHLSEAEQFKLSLTSKAFHQDYIDLATNYPKTYPIKNYYIEQEKVGETAISVNREIYQIQQSHPCHFIQSMGGIGKILNIPVMDIGTQRGGTGYLDFKVTFNSPVVRGTDRYNRSFYFANATVRDKQDNSDIEVTFKIFQRYTDAKSWIKAGNADGRSHVAEKIMDMSKHVPNGTPGVSQALTFFAKLVTEKEIGRPVNAKGSTDISGPTRIPETDDAEYSPITLAQ